MGELQTCTNRPCLTKNHPLHPYMTTQRPRHPNVEATKKHRPKFDTRAKALDTDTNLVSMWVGAPLGSRKSAAPNYTENSHFELNGGLKLR